MPKFIDHLLEALRSAAAYNQDVQAAPVCILWPDHDRQWEAAIPLLQMALPELFVLGAYAPDKGTGPAIWLRCVIAGYIENFSLPENYTPILYLPGVSRQDLRAVESCPAHLKPLAELQYRGVIWSQINSKDWTLFAFLKSNQGGLGLDVAQDKETQNAMKLAICRFLDEEMDLLKGKRLDKDYFNTLLTDGDPIRNLLNWLNQGDAFQAKLGENEWKAFVAVCKSKFAFNPQTEGILAGLSKFVEHTGPWKGVWDRYCEAPKRYPHIPAQIKVIPPPKDSLVWHTDDGSFDGWPQWNEDQEKKLRDDLLNLSAMPAHLARLKIKELEKQHSRRRFLVWADLGEAPLACALEHLAGMAEITQTGLDAGSVDDLAFGYKKQGWKADDGVIRALAAIEHKSATELEAVTVAIRSIYLPWAEDSARHLQKIVASSKYPGGTCLTAKPFSATEGDCILFIDGLRFDIGKRLAARLTTDGMEVIEAPAWAALPSVTATGKPAVSPVQHKIRGDEENVDFEPVVAETGQHLSGQYFKKLMTEAGWCILDGNKDADGKKRAWCEYGDLDHEGHDRGWKFAARMDSFVREIGERIAALFTAGWSRIHIVTDHGWLLLPGGLPKTNLHGFLTENKWGRCAILKSGANTSERLYSWYWDPNQFIALADGISCYKSGTEYAHGGLSLQECLTLHLMVTQGTSSRQPGMIIVTDLVWKKLRCTIAVEGNFWGLSLDIRTQAGNASSSVVVSANPLKDNGTASVVVENEDMEGKDVYVVLVDAKGSLITQRATRIGGGES